MDRRTTFGYILILALFVGYLVMNRNAMEEIEKQQAQQRADSVAQIEATQPAEITQAPDSIVVPDTVLEDSLVSDEAVKEIVRETFSLKNNKLEVKVSNLGGAPASLQLFDYKRYDSSALYLFEEGDHQFEYTIPLANGTVLRTSELEFKVIEQTATKLKVGADLEEGRRISQTYTLSGEDSYLIDYQVEFTGFANLIAPNNRYIELLWSNKIQNQEKDIEDERANTTVYFKYAAESGVDYLKERDDDEEELTTGVQWISFKQKFFNYTLINNTGFVGNNFEISTETHDGSDYVEDLKADMFLPVNLTESEVYNWQIFAGPNHYRTLKKLDVGLQQIIPLGWGIFGWVNKFLVIPVFHFLSQYFSSYGIIILLLTLAIKILLFLPMFKVYKSSAKMRLLKPELDEIKERTGGDMQKMQAEQMKLYKQAGVSPLGGCLPQLVQLPILFAMFRFFPSSIELRQQKLWWADDLSSYDSIWDFPGGFSIPGYGDHISLFTLLMTAITLIYTYMNSQTSAGLTGPMKWVMYLMPVMFLGIFNNYAAALSFYYFLATSITVLQNFIIRKFFIDEDKLHKEIQANKKKKVSVKKSGLQKRLEEMAKKRGVDPYKPPKRKK